MQDGAGDGGHTAGSGEERPQRGDTPEGRGAVGEHKRARREEGAEKRQASQEGPPDADDSAKRTRLVGALAVVDAELPEEGALLVTAT